jgi:hypothetical protein
MGYTVAEQNAVVVWKNEQNKIFKATHKEGGRSSGSRLRLETIPLFQVGLALRKNGPAIGAIINIKILGRTAFRIRKISGYRGRRDHSFEVSDECSRAAQQYRIDFVSTLSDALDIISERFFANEKEYIAVVAEAQTNRLQTVCDSVGLLDR